MHQYDVALKRILSRPGSAFVKALTGCTELRWFDTARAASTGKGWR
jgi:hypothetical protein